MRVHIGTGYQVFLVITFHAFHMDFQAFYCPQQKLRCDLK